METWSVDQVCMWLEEKNLGELVPRFQEEEVSGAALLALNDRMVQQLVKKIGHQAVLMDFIKKYKQSSQGPNPIGGPRGTSLLTLAQAVPEHGQNSSHTSYGDQTSLYPAKNVDNRLIDPRVLKQRRNVKHALARHKALQWTKSYVLPEFPYDVKCMLAEHKSPDHSMRIRIIEFLQADVTKYPTTQQYNDVVNALLQAHPFLDEDGCGFFLWKRALKDRFKYVRRPIEDDEQVLRNKCKFGHRRGQTRKSLADMRANEIKIVQIKVHVSTPVLEVKNPFHIGGAFVFSLYLDQEKLTKLDDCVTALATLVAAFRVFGIECPRRQSQTLNFLETLSFNVQSPPFPSLKEKEIRSQAPIT